MERSISVMMGKGSIRHNSRSFTAENVHADRTQWNVCYCNEDLKQVYHKLFDDAVTRYNQKQKRKDRWIDDYYEKIRTGKQEKLFHEAIFQVGNKDDMNAAGEHGELAKKVLDEFMENFQERNPYLQVFSAHLHMDEETPHLHVDFIPFTTESKRGLDTRVSLKQALAKQGFTGGTKQDTEWNQWIEAEKKELSKIMERYGIEWKQLGTHRKHLTVLNFEKEQRQQEVERLEQNIKLCQQKKETVVQLVVEKEKKLEITEKKTVQQIQELKKLNALQVKIEKNIQWYEEGREWQLPEPPLLMTAKGYYDTKAMPLVKRLKKVVQSLLVKYISTAHEAELLQNRLKISNKALSHRTQDVRELKKRLAEMQEREKEYSRLERYLGKEKIVSILEQEQQWEKQLQINKEKMYL